MATPHLGASTDEAQEKAGIAVAKSVRLALAGELVPDAVNVEGGVIAEDVRPFIPLAEKLGRIFTGLAGGAPEGLTVEVRGEIAEHGRRGARARGAQGRVRRRCRRAGVLRERSGARRRARRRGHPHHRPAEPRPPQPRHRARRASPTVASSRSAEPSPGPKDIEKLVEIDGYDIDLQPAEHLAFFRYHDRPGVVGELGRILGEHGVNIAGMQVSRDEQGGHALIAMTVDSPIEPEALDRDRGGDRCHEGRSLDLDDLR